MPDPSTNKPLHSPLSLLLTPHSSRPSALFSGPPTCMIPADSAYHSLAFDFFVLYLCFFRACLSTPHRMLRTLDKRLLPQSTHLLPYHTAASLEYIATRIYRPRLFFACQSVSDELTCCLLRFTWLVVEGSVASIRSGRSKLFVALDNTFNPRTASHLCLAYNISYLTRRSDVLWRSDMQAIIRLANVRSPDSFRREPPS